MRARERERQEGEIETWGGWMDRSTEKGWERDDDVERGRRAKEMRARKGDTGR